MQLPVVIHAKSQHNLPLPVVLQTKCELHYIKSMVNIIVNEQIRTFTQAQKFIIAGKSTRPINTTRMPFSPQTYLHIEPTYLLKP